MTRQRKLSDLPVGVQAHASHWLLERGINPDNVEVTESVWHHDGRWELKLLACYEMKQVTVKGLLRV